MILFIAMENFVQKKSRLFYYDKRLLFVKPLHTIKPIKPLKHNGASKEET